MDFRRKIIREFDIDFSRLNDVVVDVFDDVCDKTLTIEQAVKIFDLLSIEVQCTAFAWGGTDTEFGNNAFTFLKEVRTNSDEEFQSIHKDVLTILKEG